MNLESKTEMSVVAEIQGPVKHEFTKDEKIALFDKVYELVEKQYREEATWEAEELSLKEELYDDIELHRITETKLQAFKIGRFIEHQRFSGFINKVRSLLFIDKESDSIFLDSMFRGTIEEMIEETKEDILRDVNEDLENQGQDRIKLWKQLKPEQRIKLWKQLRVKEHFKVRKGERLDKNLLMWYCLNNHLKGKERYEQVFNKFCAGKNDPAYKNWQGLEYAVESRWVARKKEIDKTVCALQEKMDSEQEPNLDIVDLVKLYFNDHFKHKINTTFLTYDTFRAVILPKVQS